MEEVFEMSQEKVNRYKEEKLGRKDTMKKEKKSKMIRKCVGIVFAVALLGWLGFSVVKTIEDSKPREQVVVDYDAVADYIAELTAEEESTE